MDEVVRPLSLLAPPFLTFRDASYGPPTYPLTLHHCFSAVYKVCVSDNLSRQQSVIGLNPTYLACSLRMTALDGALMSMYVAIDLYIL